MKEKKRKMNIRGLEEGHRGEGGGVSKWEGWRWWWRGMEKREGKGRAELVETYLLTR